MPVNRLTVVLDITGDKEISQMISSAYNDYFSSSPAYFCIKKIDIDIFHENNYINTFFNEIKKDMPDSMLRNKYTNFNFAIYFQANNQNPFYDDLKFFLNDLFIRENKNRADWFYYLFTCFNTIEENINDILKNTAEIESKKLYAFILGKNDYREYDIQIDASALFVFTISKVGINALTPLPATDTNNEYFFTLEKRQFTPTNRDEPKTTKVNLNRVQRSENPKDIESNINRIKNDRFTILKNEFLQNFTFKTEHYPIPEIFLKKRGNEAQYDEERHAFMNNFDSYLTSSFVDEWIKQIQEEFLQTDSGFFNDADTWLDAIINKNRYDLFNNLSIEDLKTYNISIKSDTVRSPFPDSNGFKDKITGRNFYKNLKEYIKNRLEDKRVTEWMQDIYNYEFVKHFREWYSSKKWDRIEEQLRSVSSRMELLITDEDMYKELAVFVEKVDWDINGNRIVNIAGQLKDWTDIRYYSNDIERNIARYDETIKTFIHTIPNYTKSSLSGDACVYMKFSTIKKPLF